MTKDSTVRRVTVSNDDGDVHLESSGAGSEIVLKSQKVRVDGDVYCYDGDVGISQRVDGLAVKDTALSGRIDDLNATDDGLKKTDITLSGRIDDLNATDASLSSRIDVLNASSSAQALNARVDKLNATALILTPPKCVPPGGG